VEKVRLGALQEFGEYGWEEGQEEVDQLAVSREQR